MYQLEGLVKRKKKAEELYDKYTVSTQIKFSFHQSGKIQREDWK